ncbi:MAG: tail fiber domain-containing protein, partial [Bacillota bacterium]|nr:tail fiber domain-containing protein [Bacillota bacterium]
MAKEIKRMNYYNGQLLKDNDLILEQDYHIKMRRIHNRYFHDWGIVTGLEVKAVQGYPHVTVSQGFALNRITTEETQEELSQEIFFYGDGLGNVLDLSSYHPGDNIYITLSYDEEKCDIDRLKGGQEIHILENGKVNIKSAKPVNDKEELILARVALKKDELENVFVEGVYETDVDGETQLRTYAVLNGEKLEAEKLSIGPKDKQRLPYIAGINDANIGEGDGIDVHSPYTRFTGSIKSGPVSVSGNADVKGSLAVTASNNKGLKVNPNGSVDISGDVSVKGPVSMTDALTVQKGISVSGDTANIDTNNVVVSSNMVTINKRSPDADKSDNEDTTKNQGSGLEIYRGGVEPNAKLIWDENDKAWKIGMEKKEGDANSGMFNLAYGKAWENMTNGSNMDEMHKHGQLWSKDNIPVLNVDGTGDISVEQALTVFGDLKLKNGKLIAPRGEINPDAMIVWNEEKACWQVVVGDTTENIAYGSKWEELIGGTNADDLHTHNKFYSEDNSIAININPVGNVDIPQNVSVGENLTINGNLEVKGTTTTVSKVDSEIIDNVFVLNKYKDGTTPENESGIEVFRGNEKPKARMIWDEALKKWRVGIGDELEDIASGTEWNDLTENKEADGLHFHSSLLTPNGDTALAANAQGNLEASKDVEIKGSLAVDCSVKVKGELELDGSMTVNGDLTVKGTQTTVNSRTLEVIDNVIVVNRYADEDKPVKLEGGLEVYRGGTAQNARLVWNEDDSKWKIGTADNMVDLPYGSKWDTLTGGQSADNLHKHNFLTDEDGNEVVIINTEGNAQIDGDAKVQGALEVDGKVTIQGDLVVSGSVVKKSELMISDNMIELNHYDGDAPQPLKESGIEVYRGDTDKARIIWDEEKKKWRIGTGDQLEDIASGSGWEKLTQEANADALHLHSQIYNEKGDIMALSASAAGNVDIPHVLTVGNNVTVIGSLDVKGKVTTINTDKLEIKDNIITINKYQHEGPSQLDGGLEVYRGSTEQNASIIWDETDDQWEIGNSPQNPALVIESGGNVTALGTVKAAGANIEGSLRVKNGMEIIRKPEPNAQILWNEETGEWNIGVENKICLNVSEDGDVAIGSDLDVAGDAVFNGKITSASADVKTLTTNSGEFGSLTLKGGNQSNGSLIINNSGFEVPRKDANGVVLPSAKIVWDEKDSKWRFGVEDKLQDLTFNNCLYSPDGVTAALSVANKGFIGIGTTTPTAQLDVSGNTNISGKLTVRNDISIEGNAGINGSLTLKTGLEVDRGSNPSAKLVWNEDKDMWQIGVGNSLNDIMSGEHTHDTLCAADGNAVVFVDGSNV